MASDMTFPHRYQALIPPACYESLLASTLSTRHSHGPAAASCVTVVLMHGSLRSWHHGSLCAPPLLTGKPAAGRAQGHQGSHEEPPAPAVRRNPSCSSSLSPLRRCPRLHRADHLLPGGLSACLPVLSSTLQLNTAISRPVPAVSVPEPRETEKESLFHVKQRTKPGTK